MMNAAKIDAIVMIQKGIIRRQIGYRRLAGISLAARNDGWLMRFIVGTVSFVKGPKMLCLMRAKSFGIRIKKVDGYWGTQGFISFCQCRQRGDARG
jgi:hypothetical protein